MLRNFLNEKLEKQNGNILYFVRHDTNHLSKESISSRSYNIFEISYVGQHHNFSNKDQRKQYLMIRGRFIH